MTNSRRPAERALVTQLQEEREAVLDGFESRREVLRWGQRVAVRSLGQIPTEEFATLAESFLPRQDAHEGTLLSVFLTADARTRDISEDAARRERERWVGRVLAPVSVRAFRDLRKDATEYVGDSGGEQDGSEVGFDPDEQAFAMRPALSELDEMQSLALEYVIGGLDGRTDVLSWGDYLVAATRGEPVDVDRGPGVFIEKVYDEPGTVEMLCGDDTAQQRFREAFIARWLLPAFNRGVRDLTGRTAEEPMKKESTGNPGAPSW